MAKKHREVSEALQVAQQSDAASQQKISDVVQNLNAFEAVVEEQKQKLASLEAENSVLRSATFSVKFFGVPIRRRCTNKLLFCISDFFF